MILNDVKIKSGYILRELGGEFCLAFEGDTNNGAVDGIPSINETGICLWHKLEKGATPEELITYLIKKDAIDYEDAEADVGEFLAKLINAKIIDYTR
ncbi:PqqD family protein [[Clostridium] fimetarium]|uniref:Coenzyme PQQ synthesis protein D (PqqD) n=1 Tax=[Clostridium] fimetarium TaxID=99656 RepID=A0A1I0RAM7_9FIRM|nr:PqqD family protein [[Clostridium] fimetarium]SEW37887.1 Coenzyme PQQ synthesis protein D (PqqD) [[Clostridium] fimetarium]